MIAGRSRDLGDADRLDDQHFDDEDQSLASLRPSKMRALKRAAGASDPSAAKLESGQARRSLSDASDTSDDCDCSNAAADLEVARRYLLDAEARRDLTGFSDPANSAIRRFNSAVNTIEADDYS